jgi:hypothetical protein
MAIALSRIVTIPNLFGAGEDRPKISGTLAIELATLGGESGTIDSSTDRQNTYGYLFSAAFAATGGKAN